MVSHYVDWPSSYQYVVDDWGFEALLHGRKKKGSGPGRRSLDWWGIGGRQAGWGQLVVNGA